MCSNLFSIIQLSTLILYLANQNIKLVIMYGSQSKKLDKGIFKIKVAKDTLVWIYMLEELNGQKIKSICDRVTLC